MTAVDYRCQRLFFFVAASTYVARFVYNLDPKPFMTRVAEDTQLYQIIHIDGGTLRYEVRTAVREI